jgi:hypothetical protein
MQALCCENAYAICPQSLPGSKSLFRLTLHPMSQKPKRKKNPQKRLRASESGTVADKRDALISAAAQAFHNRNFYEISMDDIAEALGVTKPTL